MTSSNTTEPYQLHKWKISRTAALVVILGLAIRVYSFSYVPLFNSDGFLYIQQAKALYYGLYDSVTDCVDYLSPYPILVALSYTIFGDWVIGAQIVSLLFGTLTLVPLYWLVRRFHHETTSSLTVLCFALIPTLIMVSRDVMRDPICWFFSMMGLYLFLAQIEKKAHLLTLSSSTCFLIGVWARVEGALFILISVIYLLFTKRGHNWRRLLFFLIPLMLLLSSPIVFKSVSTFGAPALFNPKRITGRMPGVFSQYKELRENLKDLSDQRLPGFSPYFFPLVRNLVWLIALGAVAVRIVETLFYIFFVILVLGVVASVRGIPKDSRLIYLSTLCVFALIILYTQTMCSWAMTNRYAFLFLFPACVFMGSGIEAIAGCLGKRFNLKRASSYAVICLIVLVVALPKTLRATYEKDKLIFWEIGEFISKRENSRRAVSVAGAFKRVRSVHFYANLNYHGAPCFDNRAILRKPDSAALQFIQRKGYDYFVWDEVGWNGKGLDKLIKDPESAFGKIHEWQSSERGRLILYEVK